LKKLVGKTLYNNYSVGRIFEKGYFRHKLYKKGLVNNYYNNIFIRKFWTVKTNYIVVIPIRFKSLRVLKLFFGTRIWSKMCRRLSDLNLWNYFLGRVRIKKIMIWSVPKMVIFNVFFKFYHRKIFSTNFTNKVWLRQGRSKTNYFLILVRITSFNTVEKLTALDVLWIAFAWIRCSFWSKSSSSIMVTLFPIKWLWKFDLNNYEKD